MSKEKPILQPGMPGYAEAVAKVPVHNEDGTLNRVPTFADAQRAADAATNAETLAKAKADKPAAAATKEGGK